MRLGTSTIAITKEGSFIPAYTNLADLYRQMGAEEKSQSILLKALKVNGSAAVIHHALGLSLVRQKKTEQAIKSLQQASILEPDNSQFNLVYAIALNSSGNTDAALTELETFHERHPMNGQILMTISTLQRDKGDISESLFYAEKLLDLIPDNIQIQEHIKALKQVRISE